MDTEHKEPKQAQEHKAGPEVLEDNSNANADSIHYEDGKV